MHLLYIFIALNPYNCGYKRYVLYCTYICTLLRIFVLGDIPPCAKEQLPVPANGDVSCEQWPDALRCTLTCQDMFAFGSSVDFSPQYCRDGVWDYQRYKQNLPSCQRKHTIAILSFHSL